MRMINSLICAITDLINTYVDYPVNAIPLYKSSLMDLPLTKPTIAVGIDSMDLDMSKLSAYGGIKDSVQNYSIPAEIKLRANIYVPQSMHGDRLYDALSLLVEVLFYSSGLIINSVHCGDMFSNDTIRCIVLPVTISIHHRISGNS